MKRNIQFNAWDIRRKKMIHGVAVHQDGSIGFGADTARKVFGHDYTKWPGGFRVSWVFMEASEVIILQSSEMPDKHGRMMYDGHIVECLHQDPLESDGHSATYHHITFKDGSFGWLGETTNQFHPFSEDVMSDCEIVGTIFENPELLEKNKPSLETKACIACKTQYPLDYFTGGTNPDKCSLCDELPF